MESRCEVSLRKFHLERTMKKKEAEISGQLWRFGRLVSGKSSEDMQIKTVRFSSVFLFGLFGFRSFCGPVCAFFCAFVCHSCRSRTLDNDNVSPVLGA